MSLMMPTLKQRAPVIFPIFEKLNKGINLRELTIPYEPSKYDRKIAEYIFGKNAESELIHSMIEPEGNKPNRPAADLQKTS